MTRRLRHIILPAFVPLIFLLVAATPVEAFGCRNRGLLALAIAVPAMLGALYAAVKAASAGRRRDSLARWWASTSLILAVPVVLLLILA